MRINTQNLDASLAAQNRPDSTGRVTKANSSHLASGSGAAVTSGDQATLGSSTVGLTAQVLAQPPVRSDLVQQLRAQIANGTYTVDPTQVAEAMLNDPQTSMGPRGNG